MLEILRKRRSIRKYKDQKIEPAVIDPLKEAILRTPSSRGINPWRFIFITDKSMLEALSKAKESGSGFLKGAALGVVVCARESESDVWVEDCSIAAIVLQLAAESLGLGSCWIQIRNRKHIDHRSAEEYVREALHLADDMKVECIISIGYPDEELAPVPKEELEYGKIARMGDFN
ncbi:MAG: NAD(P)H-dependent dehydrogenase/reductase [Methanothrix sp.]|nr:MAG: NAD(P)H-dependent dehydrogenase/reductase [Methanothrix sp.]